MSSVPTHSASSFTVCSPCGDSSNDKNNDDDDSVTTLSSPLPSSTNSSPGAGLDSHNAVPIAAEHLEIYAASALQQLKQQQQPPPPPITTTTNVGELVNKAKKAAASLWMILHAQVCI